MPCGCCRARGLHGRSSTCPGLLAGWGAPRACRLRHHRRRRRRRPCLAWPAGVLSTGHCHPRVVEAIRRQAGEVIMAQQNLLPASKPMVRAAGAVRRALGCPPVPPASAAAGTAAAGGSWRRRAAAAVATAAAAAVAAPPAPRAPSDTASPTARSHLHPCAVAPPGGPAAAAGAHDPPRPHPPLLLQLRGRCARGCCRCAAPPACPPPACSASGASRPGMCTLVMRAPTPSMLLQRRWRTPSRSRAASRAART